MKPKRERTATVPSLRNLLLAANDANIVPAQPTPEWPEVDGQIFLRSISAAERLRYAHTLRDRDPNEEADVTVWTRLLVLCLCDAEGRPLFTDEEADLLAEKSAAVLHRLFLEACAHNVIGGTSQRALAKN